MKNNLVSVVVFNAYISVLTFSVFTSGFSCSCSHQFTGGNCEMKKTVCVPNPCQNSGVCKPIGNAFLCSCRRGFRGLV